MGEVIYIGGGLGSRFGSGDGDSGGSSGGGSDYGGISGIMEVTYDSGRFGSCG